MRLSATAAMLLVLAATTLPAQSPPTDRLIQSLQLRVKVHPEDPAAYDKLGAAYIQKGRETGDARYYELAKQALSKSLDLEPDGPGAVSAQTHLAVVYMAEHRFDQALWSAENALALGSGDLSPWAIVVDALTDKGEYDKALEYCSRLESPVGRGLRRDWSYERNSRLSYLKFISGDPKGATELMESAIQAAITNQMPRENIAWSQYQLGDEYYRTGNLGKAESAYQDALATYPDYYRALAGLAAVRTAQKRYPEAIELYKQAIAAIPDPIFVASLGDAYAKVGRPDEAKNQYALVEFIGRLSEINKVLYNRELALFYADHDVKLQEAVKLARQELEVRRDVYTWDTLAWALYKSGQASEAREAMGKALAPGTRDVILFFHAGMIYDGVGETAKAKDYLDRALSADPNFHPLYAEMAARKLGEVAKRAEATGR